MSEGETATEFTFGRGSSSCGTGNRQGKREEERVRELRCIHISLRLHSHVSYALDRINRQPKSELPTESRLSGTSLALRSGTL